MSLQPLILKKMIESISLSRVTIRQSTKHYWFYSYIAITALLSAVLRIYHYLALHYYPNIRKIIVIKIHNHLIHKHSLDTLEKHPGVLIKAIQELTSHIEICCQICIEMVIPRILALFGANITLCILASPIYAGLLSCWTAAYLAITWQFIPPIMHNSRLLSAQHHKLFGWLSDTIDNHHIIRSYHQQTHEQDQLAHILNQYIDHEKKLLKIKLKASVYQTVNMITCLSILICTLLSSTPNETSAGTLTLVIGITQAFMHATHYLGTCLINLSKSISVCNQALESLHLSIYKQRHTHANNSDNTKTAHKNSQYTSKDKYQSYNTHHKNKNSNNFYLNDLKSTPQKNTIRNPWHKDHSNHRKKHKQCHAIRIHNLYYQRLQQNFKIQIPYLNVKTGEKILLVGSSGSGKSTLAKLIAHHYIPSKGSIAIPSFKRIQINRLHDHVSYIPQKPALLNRSIFDNIRLGRQHIPNEQIIKICQKCLCHDFIMRFADQYSTIVGNSGMQLSLGQQQRIILARCLLEPAPIIILDEATAHIDRINEQQILQNLQALFKEKTVIHITHSHEQDMINKRIISMQNGRITKDIKPSYTYH